MFDERTRGQTSVDFAVAMGVFLIAVTTVVAFMPGIIDPFAGGQSNPLLADRLATQLVDYQLGDPATPSALNATCTMYFFNGTAGAPCASFDPGDDLTEKLGIEDDRYVNVTLKANVTDDPGTEVLCADSAWSSAGDCSDATYDADKRLAVGEPPPTESGSVMAARRKALLGDRQVYVVVRTWT